MPKLKPTTQEKVDAIAAILYAIHFDLREDGMWQMYTPGMQQEIEREIARLEARKQRLLQPKPRKPSKPKAQASGKVTGSTSVHFEPDGEYENSMPRSGKNNRNG